MAHRAVALHGVGGNGQASHKLAVALAGGELGSTSDLDLAQQLWPGTIAVHL